MIVWIGGRKPCVKVLEYRHSDNAKT